jgi:hypothetical protein
VTHTTTSSNGVTYTTVTHHICPDLLRWSDIGAADNWRGRAVRLCLSWLRWVPPW